MTSGSKEAVISALLDARGSIAVVSHVNPDGDAIGSTLGLCLILNRLGRHAVPRLAEDAPAPGSYDFLPGWEDLVPLSPGERPDVLVALDATDPARLGDAASLLEQVRLVVTIDHHPDNSGFGDPAWIDSSAAAVGAMLWEALPEFGIEPDADLATCLYAALLTDTGRFTHDNTDARSLHLAAEMVGAGADPAAIARAVYQRRSPGALGLTGLILSRITLANDGRVAYSWLDQADLEACNATIADAEDLVDRVRLIDGPEAVFLAKVHDGEIRLSLRAKGAFDVGAVARRLGGGGHRAAAGATVSGDLDHTLGLVLPMLPGGNG